jgi:VanZ family protein
MPVPLQPALRQVLLVARPVFWLLLLAVITLSLLPSPYLPPQAFSLWDKAQHALGFAVLAFCGGLAYSARLGRLGIGLLLLGGAIELAQHASGWRQGDWADLLADVIGLAAGLILALLVLCLARR